MFRFIPRSHIHRAATPLLLAAFILPPQKRRERASPIVASVGSIAWFTAFFVPQIPIPDTSKIKDTILSKLPSWTIKGASSTFRKKPQADMVVGLSLENKSFRAYVAFYPKGTEIVKSRGSAAEPDGEAEWIELARPGFIAVEGWNDFMPGEETESEVMNSSRSITFLIADAKSAAMS